jgi:precorrin-3B methylase
MTEPVTEDGIESAWNACKYRGYCSRLHVENADVMVERDRLRAEVERLREALERAAECGLRDEIHAALKEPK